MPSRHIKWAKRLSFADLPILPFLAPRIFTPWPSSFHGREHPATIRLVHQTASAYISKNSHAVDDDELEFPTNSRQQEGNSDVAAIGRNTESIGKEQVIKFTIKDIAQKPRRSTSYQGTDIQSISEPAEVPDTLNIPNRDFLDAYQQIWGAAPAMNAVEVPVQKAADQFQMIKSVRKGPVRSKHALRTSDSTKSISSGDHAETLGQSGDRAMSIKRVLGQQHAQKSKKIDTVDVDSLTRLNDNMKLEEQLAQDSSSTKNDSSVSGSRSQTDEQVIRRKHKARKGLLAYRITRRIVNKNTLRTRPRQQKYTSDGVASLKFNSKTWSANFASLSRRFDNYDDSHIVPGSSQRSFRRLTVKRGSMLRSTIDSLAKTSAMEFTEKWRAISPLERTSLWLKVMLVVLGKNPQLALKFLMATSFKPYPPGYAMSDSLEYILSYYLYRVKHQDAKTVTILFRAVVQLLNELEKGYMQLTQKTLFWLISHLTIEQIAHFYSTLVQSGQIIHENTQLHFVDTFARKGWTDLAVKALQRLSDNGADFAKPKIESVCATLLQRRYRSGSETILSDSELFASMLDLGLRPNIIFYNILVQNAIDGGDSDTAWQIHDTILEDGIGADATTYSILLHDAKLRLDRPVIERIAETVRTKQIRDGQIVTDLLHAMFLLHEKDQRNAPIGTNLPSPLIRMLPLFCEYFEAESTKELIITKRYIDFAPQTQTEKMRPPKEALTVMFCAVLKGFKSPKSTAIWYERFRELVLGGHQDILPLVESTRIYDAVIMSLGSSSKTLYLCTKVIGDMYSSHSKAWEAVRQATTKAARKLARNVRRNPTHLALQEDLQNLETAKKSPGHCRPSVWTWSILLKAFMDHNQPRAAEEVLNMMGDRGTPPNQVTWNSLAMGYARMQNITGTVNTIERLENQGWEVGDGIMESLQRIRNREALVQALLQARQRRNNGQEITDNNSSLVRRVVNTREKLIDTARVSHRKSNRPMPRKWLRPPKFVKFVEGELLFPMDVSQRAQVGDEGSFVPGIIDSNSPKAQDRSVGEGRAQDNQLADSWKRGWI